MKVDGSHVALRRTGRVWMREGLRWPGKAIRECRIREHGGRWYASVRVEIEEVEYTGHCGQGVLGIDLGLKTFATIAYPDGTVGKVQAPEPLRRSLRSLRQSQRKLARRKVGSRTGPGPGGTWAFDVAAVSYSVHTNSDGSPCGNLRRRADEKSKFTSAGSFRRWPVVHLACRPLRAQGVVSAPGRL